MTFALRAAAIAVGFGVSLHAFAGAQQYEPLSAAVQTQLQRSVSDAAVTQPAFADDAEAQVWLKVMSDRLKHRMPDEAARREFLITAHYEAKRAGLDPHLVLGLIQVESNFRKYAVSSAGARGFMQVMPFWVKVIGNAEHNLFHLRTSLRYGCTILRHYLDIEGGDMTRALARYNGSLGKQSDYADKVLSAWRNRWSWDGSAPSRAAAASPPATSPATPPRAKRPAAPMRYLGASG
ncbi:MAG: transglycosylase SLT domain-containing protein [Burkholderiales bacterium]